ncbi:protein-glutamate methylesterase/protein-glutamine glutaminase [Anaeroarcus burkinensis]|uniref:protein-glutamate methylesterase/protein-glutamine glutaminase n=1 Tax=Anaeroarcus burkinensis TaxID=82376 RepID=UPI00041423A3|nr:chemotaxis response regulator protein-glutamate methylesterase [Anaeroarcus burkinensis]
MIRILIVDDSAFMRKLLSDLFAGEKDFVVVDTARNGKEAVEKTKLLQPDLVTLDVEMPIMDGLEALRLIMQETPTPVMMVSSLTKAGADATMRALDLGAVDFIAKTNGPISSIQDIRQEILAKAREAVLVNVRRLARPQTTPITPRSVLPFGGGGGGAQGTDKIVAIGTSTGGPRALQEIITRLPKNLPCGVLIVQHMPPGFTRSLAERLNSLSDVQVKEAEPNEPIRPGWVYIAPGDHHMRVERSGGQKILRLSQDPLVGGHRPAVDPMFDSVAQSYGKQTVAVLLTGMGHDGAQGMKKIKEHQGFTIAEDQSTSVVFGMPKSAIELGVVDRVVPLQAVAAEIIKAVSL